MTEESSPSDSSAQPDQKEIARLKREREVEDFKWLMAMKQGRRFMWRLLGITRLHQTPHHVGSSAEDNAFRAGGQNIGLLLQAEIHALCPEQYAVMLEDQRKENARSREPRN